jgi:periplasmic divalent cation tolerance protein
MEYGHVVMLVTIGTPEEASRLADALLGARLIACANIVPAVDSRFRWQGKLERETEALIVIKTAASRVDEVVRLVKELHPYDVPEVIALPVVGGNSDYLEWVSEEAAKGDTGTNS